MSSIQSQGRQTVTAFFDSRADADRAAERIRSEGLSPSDVRVVEGDSDTAGAAPRKEHKGFWAALGDFFLPNEDRYAYAEGLSRGGFLVSVATTDANRSRVVDILDDEGTVDFDAREASWRSEGWQGYRADDAGYRADEEIASHSYDPSVADNRRDNNIGNTSFGTGGVPVSGATTAGTAPNAIGGTTAAAGASAAATGVDAGALSGTTSYDRQGEQRFGRRDTSISGSRVRAYHSDDLGGNVVGDDRLDRFAEQVDRTDVEMEDRREEGLLDRDEIARREAGRSH